MASVSTLARSIGATNPVTTVNFSMLFGRFLDGLAAFLDVLANALNGIAAGKKRCHDHKPDD
jgi:hypothetical protein